MQLPTHPTVEVVYSQDAAAGGGPEQPAGGDQLSQLAAMRPYEEGSFLAGVSAETAATIARLGRRGVFPRGTVLVTQGQTPRLMLVLLRGRVKIGYHTDDGREVLFDILGPGELVGEISVLDGKPSDATATAIDDVEALVVEAEAFDQLVAADSEAGRGMLQMLSRRLRKAMQDRAALAMNDALGRVCLRLVELADRYGELVEDRIRITLPLSQQELAAWTGTSREATSKALHALRRRGWIETRRREIHVLDVDELRDRVIADPRELQVDIVL